MDWLCTTAWTLGSLGLVRLLVHICAHARVARMWGAGAFHLAYPKPSVNQSNAQEFCKHSPCVPNSTAHRRKMATRMPLGCRALPS